MSNSDRSNLNSSDTSSSASEQPSSNNEPFDRDSRRYAVSNQRGKARGKVRYIEGNAPKDGCRFL